MWPGKLPIDAGEPGILSWLPEPSSKHLRHLNFRMLGAFVSGIDLLVHRHRSAIYLATLAVTIFALIGMNRLYSVSYMVDDLPEDSQVKRDLKFFESNFSGVMPLEIVVEIESKRKRQLLEVDNLQAIDEFEQFLDSITVTSRPVSIVSLVKAAKQAFYNNNPELYSLPTKSQRMISPDHYCRIVPSCTEE